MTRRCGPGMSSSCGRSLSGTDAAAPRRRAPPEGGCHRHLRQHGFHGRRPGKTRCDRSRRHSRPDGVQPDVSGGGDARPDDRRPGTIRVSVFLSPATRFTATAVPPGRAGTSVVASRFARRVTGDYGGLAPIAALHAAAARLASRIPRGNGHAITLPMIWPSLRDVDLWVHVGFFGPLLALAAQVPAVLPAVARRSSARCRSSSGGPCRRRPQSSSKTPAESRAATRSSPPPVVTSRPRLLSSWSCPGDRGRPLRRARPHPTRLSRPRRRPPRGPSSRRASGAFRCSYNS